ncbi:MAG: 2-C-methyl-D-erythritol 4-phosphate cytidylyltransferase [Eubacteriales bacterium]|nr:2-C-methyl-D-erythritol 4-phosphate cytidylyltransferase [Eubacteriales bacterium]
MEETGRKKPKFVAVVLAAGTGSRMHSDVKKQYMELRGLPVVVRSLLRFEENELIDSVVLVTGRDDLQLALSLSLKYNLRKVKNIVEGGDQRYKSVYNGAKAAGEDTDYILIHDGARPLVSDELITRCCREVVLSRACVAAVPVKDTIKRCDTSGFAAETLERASLFAVQTPQAFSYPLFMEAYANLFRTIRAYHPDESKITDDAMIVEAMSDQKVKLIPGDYKNIKLTTPEDMVIAEAFL